MSEKKWLASDGKTELRPFDKVLARDRDLAWMCSIFSSYNDESDYPYLCVGDCFEECIPYAGNEFLLDTFDPIPEPRQDAPQTDKPLEWGELVRVWDDDLDDKLDALFVRELASPTYPYEVLERGRTCLTQWKHCERA